VATTLLLVILALTVGAYCVDYYAVYPNLIQGNPVKLDTYWSLLRDWVLEIEDGWNGWGKPQSCAQLRALTDQVSGFRIVKADFLFKISML
jgi:hypothetical protein